MIVGYARVSTVGQSLDVQLNLLREAGCAKVFGEKRTGRSRDGREELAEALEFVREGDTLAVTRLDRLARSVSDLFAIIDQLQAKGVHFRCLQQSGVDTDSSTGRLMLGILGAVAAFEADIRKERQADGIARAKAAGVYKGRKPTVDTALVRSMHSEGKRPADIARELKIGRASVYRAIQGAAQVE
ncbi:recombinase family protein [Sphingomonas phyllosphaerae]|uniref:recombinase family protein n=1 Tax=Sphingomonas phyllosphaerae TaxID=257003 RepID=UPI002413AEA4|nr:recombinase family protein [Sphingomonas phyllosphaerae]